MHLASMAQSTSSASADLTRRSFNTFNGPPSPRPAIAQRGSSKHALTYSFLDHDPSPPSTPKNKPRSRRKGKEPVQRPGGRPERPTTSGPRHSHGLSWSSTTRDSVVDNLLLSLDGLSSQMNATFESAGIHIENDDGDDDDDERDRIRQAPLHALDHPSQRQRGHTYSSSSASERTASPVYRTRRSYSNTHNRTNLPSSRYSQSHKKSSSETARTALKQQTNGHTRDNSDSSLAGQDYDTVKESGRLAWGGAGRSISLDHISINSTATSVMNRGRPVPSAFINFDQPALDHLDQSTFSNFDQPANAAPEPMIPAGPRKMQNPNATGPVYLQQSAKQSALRKTTTQSDLRSTSNPTIPQNVRDKASDFVRNSSFQDKPSVPKVGDRTVTASTSGDPTRRSAPSPHRERQGFFKRVFGSSNKSNDRAISPVRTSETTKENRKPVAAAAAATANASGSNLRNEVHQLPNQTSVTATSQPPVSLNKKPSSFFRRRKKSTGENSLPPPLPTHLVDHGKLTHAQSSLSGDSLRKVMDPSLQEEDWNAPSTAHVTSNDGSRPVSQVGDAESLEIFHSGYTSPPDASIHKPLPARASQDHDDRLKVKVRKQNNAAAVHIAHLGQPSPAVVSNNTLVAPMGRDISPVSAISAAPGESERRPRAVSRASTGDRILASKASSASEDMRVLASGSSPELDMSGTQWLATQNSPRSEKIANPSVFLRPSNDDLGKRLYHNRDVSPQGSRGSSRSASRSASTALPSVVEQSPTTPSTAYHSATSLPLVQMDGMDVLNSSLEAAILTSESESEHKERARRIFDGDEEDVPQMEAASWLGENKTLNKRTLAAYMKLWDFTGINVLAALRALCGKLVLRGETQQFDRIITALSSRWCECNPDHGFKAQDVVHTMLYSLILLNTDLHMADIGDKMSKSAYVKNTLPTVRRVVADAAPGAFDETIRPATTGQSRPGIPWPEPRPDPRSELQPSRPTSPALPPDTPQDRTSFDLARANGAKRMSIRPVLFRGESDGFTPDSASGSSSNALVNSQFVGPMRAWEVELEAILKSFWTSIKSEPLPLLSLSVSDVRSSERNLSVGGIGRAGSVASRTPSDTTSYRSKPGLRSLAMGWQGRSTRSRPKMHNPPSTVGSSRTSFDDDSSMWSGVQSSTWSSKNSYGKTMASSSVSLGHFLSPVDASFKHSIGFANALSQAIIREEGAANGGDTDSITIKGDLLEDESLTLEGAPWAKEGIVKQRHEFEATDRKAKDRSWSSDFFAVISKGKLTLFNFNTTAKSRSLGRQRLQKTPFSSKAASIASTQVGGGDWMGNAEQIASFALRHTVAVTLPSGYNKHRYVWALRLPGGACHLFDVGTPEIAVEWVETANYWAARLSKEPLIGGVSNIEYGWSDALLAISSVSPNLAKPSTRSHTHTQSSSTGTTALSRPSMQGSVRGSVDIGNRTRLAGDKAQLTDWQMPSPSMMASQLMEVDQMKTMIAYVANAERELEGHNELKEAIEAAYSPHSANLRRALANWQHKSEYLLREIVKFRTYIESLAAAMKAKDEVLAKRESTRLSAINRSVDISPDGGRDITPRQSRVPGVSTYE